MEIPSERFFGRKSASPCSVWLDDDLQLFCKQNGQVENSFPRNGYGMDTIFISLPHKAEYMICIVIVLLCRNMSGIYDLKIMSYGRTTYPFPKKSQVFAKPCRIGADGRIIKKTALTKKWFYHYKLIAYK